MSKQSKLILGVDGGNTKTDYMLLDDTGRLMKHIRKGTVSHENLPGSYAQAAALIASHVAELGVTPAELDASAMGLAGLDMPFQYENLHRELDKQGFTHYKAVNDGYLGLKAGAPTGAGICSISGTGNVSVGIDPEGRSLQVGGVGPPSCDDGGGGYLKTKIVRAVYSEIYRFEAKTALTPALFALTGVKHKEQFLETVIPRLHGDAALSHAMLDALFDSADAGDAVSVEIITHAGKAMARSAAGCTLGLHFTGSVDVILAGSIWAKASNQMMKDIFAAEFDRCSSIPGRFSTLTLPPASGAALWALELANGVFPDVALSQKVFTQIEDLRL